MKPDARVLLEDIITCSNNILKETSKLDFASYSRNMVLKAAVERWFITIGQALTRIRDHHPDLANRLPDITVIIDFRNFLVHNYDSLEDIIIWSSITDDLPFVYETVCSLHNELEQAVPPQEELQRDPPKPSGPSGPRMQ